MKRLADNRGVDDPTPPLVQIVPASAAEAGFADTRVEPLRITYTQTRRLPDAIGRVRRLPGVATSVRSELGETFKMLRHRLRQRMATDGHRVLGVTSARPIPGKTLTALNVALALAADLDASVLLVDADLSGTGLQHLFGLDGVPGLGEHLAHGRPLPELLLNPGIDRFVLLPAGRCPTDGSAELLASRNARQLVAELKQRYDDRTIVVDLPPLLERADAMAFLPLLDTTLLVAEDHGTTTPDLERVADLLAPYNLLGSVLAPSAPKAEAPAEARRWRRWFGRRAR